jgi:hypothetical protein
MEAIAGRPVACRAPQTMPFEAIGWKRVPSAWLKIKLGVDEPAA